MIRKQLLDLHRSFSRANVADALTQHAVHRFATVFINRQQPVNYIVVSLANPSNLAGS